jgi:hypothetical protein
MTLAFLSSGLTTVVLNGGVSVQVANTNMGVNGGVIINPQNPIDQGIHIVEPLYISLIGPANLIANQNTTVINPGDTFNVPPLSNVWVNAATSGHSFTAIFLSPYEIQYPPTIVPGQPGSGVGALPGTSEFPPSSVTGLTTVIPSYLYQEYSDDDDLQGFVAAQNELQQDYVDTFNALNLPIYPGPIVEKALLDWVGQGVYGMARPAIGTGIPLQIGPLNTWAPNWRPWDVPPVAFPVAPNMLDQLTVGDVVITNDDLYRRILTWHFYKGDGNYCDVRWLKRRIWRFCFGVNGWGYNGYLDTYPDASIADTEQISISFGVDRNCTIRFVLGHREVGGGMMLNKWGPNGFGPSTLHPASDYKYIALNEIRTMYTPFPPLPMMAEFKEAVDIGALELPYQFQYTVHIG